VEILWESHSHGNSHSHAHLCLIHYTTARFCRTNRGSESDDIFLKLFFKLLTAYCLTLVCAGNRGELIFNLNNYSTKAEVLTGIERTPYFGENTNTTGGLKVARLEVFGDHYQQRQNIDRIIILITDGTPTRDRHLLPDEVARIRSMGIRILGVGVSNLVSQLLLTNAITYVHFISIIRKYFNFTQLPECFRRYVLCLQRPSGVCSTRVQGSIMVICCLAC